MEQKQEAVKQSRVGKAPISILKGVDVKIDGRSVSFKGPKGELVHQIHDLVDVKKDGDRLIVSPKSQDGASYQGLTRALLANAVKGVSEGFKSSLDLYGVGYRAELKGQMLTLSLGLSHQIKYELPAGVKCKIETIDEAGLKRPRVHLECHDKSLLGQAASRIKSFRPPEPYKGKGVRFTGERIREKAGKAGKGA
ncbi:MAG: 50S ribosomal protein L6 [Deltaproteobacteria bacterium]|nr:MAG: 50S ribosomal protein L6 [Deltaproteobacteria bacterium]